MPEKVTFSETVFAVLNLTVILVLLALPPFSTIVPAIVIAAVFITAKVELLLRVMLLAMVTSSLTVAVLFPAIVRLFAVTAALKWHYCLR